MAIKCFIWESVRIMSEQKLVRVCEHHASILRRAINERSLSSDEADFLYSCELYQDGLLGIIQLRSAARKYFNE